MVIINHVYLGTYNRLVTIDPTGGRGDNGALIRAFGAYKPQVIYIF